MTSSDQIPTAKSPWTWVLISVLVSVTISSLWCMLLIAYNSGLQQTIREQSDKINELSERIERLEQLLLAHVKKVDGPTATALGHSNTAVINAGYEQLIREDMEFWRKVKLNEHMRGIGVAVEPGTSGTHGPAVCGGDGTIGCQCEHIRCDCGVCGPCGCQLPTHGGQRGGDREEFADRLHPIDDVQPRLHLNLVP